MERKHLVICVKHYDDNDNDFISTYSFTINGNDHQVNKTASIHNIQCNFYTSTIYLPRASSGNRPKNLDQIYMNCT